ncbi:hypothetical protein NX774_12180 [Massilia agilis]|uniref:Uncharacterized protein n=1 Tax=Massilia agilis TaxID=1811226 RepID=A0ABT2DBH6_9BURK|nr:hypothetical protein [Massilia agilis]MCS0808678.1 hypothetical protein [Massilia agilis]
MKELFAHLPDILMLAGAAAISFGAGMVSMPAGWIVGGAFALAGGVILARGDK